MIVSRIHSTKKLLSVFVIVTFRLFEAGRAFVLDRSRLLSSARPMRSFDFASPSGWDDFYKHKQSGTDTPVGSSVSTTTTTTTTTTEWHSSISLEDIASVVQPESRCLVVGCGNSKLPDAILGLRSPPRSLVLMDTSPTCLDQLRERYRRDESRGTKTKTSIEYVCGDATRLSEYFGGGAASGISGGLDGKDGNGNDNGSCNNSNGNNDGLWLFDIVIDKGLTDAILCGEGWDGPLEKLFHESAKILSADTGRYLLISYKLPPSTKDFLVDVGYNAGLEWDFGFDLGTTSSSTSSSQQSSKAKPQRVGVAMARRSDKTF